MADPMTFPVFVSPAPPWHPGPWRWQRTHPTPGGPWTAVLLGRPNGWNDRLVTAMREDLAQFPYAITTPTTALLEAAPELAAATAMLLRVFDTLLGPEAATVPPLTAARALLARVAQAADPATLDLNTLAIPLALDPPSPAIPPAQRL